MNGSRTTRGRGLIVLLGVWAAALAATAAFSTLSVPRVVVALVASGLVAYAVTEAPPGRNERPARGWPQDESAAGG